MKKAPLRVSSEGEIFTYAQGTSVSPIGAKVEHYDCAIYIPEKFAGNKIDDIGFYIVDKSVVANVKCWIADKLPTDIPADCGFVQDVTPTNDLLTNGMPCEAETGGYTIPSGGCYVGYSFDVTNLNAQYGLYPLAMDGGTDTEGGAYINMGNGFESLSGAGFGNLLTFVVISGDKFANNAVSIVDDGFEQTSVKEGTVSVTASLLNDGLNPVTSINYTVKDVETGNVSAEQMINLDEPLGFNQMAAAVFQIEANSEVGKFEKEITITKVNGLANENVGSSVLKGSLIVVSRKVSKKVVVEELTGTGCPNCPRGYAGMAALADKYPDEFIGISPHFSINYYDPMQNESYADLAAFFEGYISVPTCFVNRKGTLTEFDPYNGSSSKPLGIFDVFESVRGDAEVEIVTSAMWNENETTINVSTDVTFLYNATDPYALAYVLVADGLQGNEDYWWQYNGSSNMYGNTATGEPYLDEWLTKGEIDNIPGYSDQGVFIKDMVYDHVALLSENLLGDVSNVSSPVMDKKQTYTTSFDVSGGVKGYYLGNELIQDKTKLKVVAMLINTKTGEILNADEKSVTSYVTDGIENVATTGDDAVEVARYSLDGTKLSAPTPGVNIVKMSDGTAKKVVVK